ncbi:tetraspanin family protein [Micrococcaceae bacterium RIT802]|nr:tetraspanin family protein [Micrococcaceae bacterium RIT 802]
MESGTTGLAGLPDTADAAFLLLAVGIVLVILGVSAYRGSFRRWRGRTLYAGYLGPGLLYLGSALALGGLVLFLPGGDEVRNGPIGILATFIFGAAFILGVAGGVFAFVWMPRFLRPQWVREVEGDIGDDALARARLPEWTLAARREAGVREGRGEGNDDVSERRAELSASLGPRLDRRGLDYLDRLSFHDRRAWARAGASGGELVSAGLAGPDGAPTGAGLALTQPRRSGAPILRITTDHDGERLELSLFRAPEFDYAIWSEAGSYRVDALAHEDIPDAIISWLSRYRESTGWDFIRGTHELLGSFAVVDGMDHEVTGLPEGSAVRDGRVLDADRLRQRVTDMAARIR